MVHADLDASTKKLKGVEQKIVDLEEALHLARGEECQLKSDVQVQSSLLVASEKDVDVRSKLLLTLRWCPLSRLMMQRSWRDMSKSC